MANNKENSLVATGTVYQPRSAQKSTRTVISLRTSDYDSLENIRTQVNRATGKTPSQSLIFRYGLNKIEEMVKDMDENQKELLLKDMVYVSSDVNMSNK